MLPVDGKKNYVHFSTNYLPHSSQGKTAAEIFQLSLQRLSFETGPCAVKLNSFKDYHGWTICRNSSVNEQYEHLTLLCVLVVGSSQCPQYNSIDGINTRTLGEHFRLTSSQNVGQKRPPDASSISTFGLQCLSDPWAGPKDLTMGPPRTLCSTNTPRVRLNLEILLRTLHGLSVTPRTIYFLNEASLICF